MKKELLFVFVIIFLGILNFSQLNSQKGAEVILQGKTIVKTGKIIGTQIRFVNSTGKTIVCNSNSIDGKFQAVLTSGNSYYVFIKDYLLESSNFQIDIPIYSKYEEINQDLNFKPIEPRTILFNLKAFEPNDSAVKQTDFIKLLKSFMEVNQDVKFEIELSSYDSWLSPTKRTIQVKDKKGKIVNKTVNYTIKEQLSDLLDGRINALKAELRKYKINFKENVYLKDIKVVDAKKKMKKREIPGNKKKSESYLPEIENLIIRII